jgi:hypothetical protein
VVLRLLIPGLKSAKGAKQMRSRLCGFTAVAEDLQILRDCSIPIEKAS